MKINWKEIFYLLLCVAVIVGSAFILLSCKPSMPKRADYGDNVPCYLADRIVIANTYTENKTPVDDALTKCWRYTDYDKCKKEKDFDECWSKLGIRK